MAEQDTEGGFQSGVKDRVDTTFSLFQSFCMSPLDARFALLVALGWWITPVKFAFKFYKVQDKEDDLMQSVLAQIAREKYGQSRVKPVLKELGYQFDAIESKTRKEPRFKRSKASLEKAKLFRNSIREKVTGVKARELSLAWQLIPGAGLFIAKVTEYLNAALFVPPWGGNVEIDEDLHEQVARFVRIVNSWFQIVGLFLLVSTKNPPFNALTVIAVEVALFAFLDNFCFVLSHGHIVWSGATRFWSAFKALLPKRGMTSQKSENDDQALEEKKATALAESNEKHGERMHEMERALKPRLQAFGLEWAEFMPLLDKEHLEDSGWVQDWEKVTENPMSRFEDRFKDTAVRRPRRPRPSLV